MGLKDFLKTNPLLLFAAVYGFVFLGCSTVVPFTEDVLKRVGTEQDIGKFQYYISSTVTLQRVDQSLDTRLVGGQAKIRSQTLKNIITITDATPGVALAWDPAGSPLLSGWQIKVAFESNDANYLIFSKGKTGPEYWLAVYRDEGNSQFIIYGGEKYSLSYDDAPFLLVKMSSRAIEKERKRRLRGRILK